ncbi:MAG TPA: acyclic terpene utilization AtuA family protein, partial [Acidimicrobiia bacterium]|nr:acyclic terpene utilization AtuA family protein [Acidimicrobiia bacterium]
MIRIANCSGFYGDRRSAAREMVEGGPIDYLTGDYLAELTMALLWRHRSQDPGGGYARTFLGQMEDVLGTCLDRGIKIVSNAGGLNPAGLADDLGTLAARLGLTPTIATVTGDDLMERLGELDIRSFADGSALAAADFEPVTANAYLGCWGIASALDEGADLVVTGRVTDAALVMGPAAHHFGWSRQDWDRLAGALVAGHVIECGAQASGGNFSFFTEVPGLDHVGFPLVELAEDGSFVVTKHPGTGGMVTPETVTAQLLYEIGGHRYFSPDVTARFDTIRLTGDGEDRVRVDGVVGEPPPETLKVAVNRLGGYRNQVNFVITGLQVREKAAAAEDALWAATGGRHSFASAEVRVLGEEVADPASNEAAMARLSVTVTDLDPDKVGRHFSGTAVELALASYPGFFLAEPPGDASPYAVYWPATVPGPDVPAQVSIAGRTWSVPGTLGDGPGAIEDEDVAFSPDPPGVTVRVPLGAVAGTRSGDKGGDANVGVWVRQPEAFGWLASFLTIGALRRLLPEAATLDID